MRHGESLSLEAIQSGEIRPFFGADAKSEGRVPLFEFGYLFPREIRDPALRLPDGRATRDRLIALGCSVAGSERGHESTIPAAYTFLGQFIDHDMTFDAETRAIKGGIFDAVAAMPPEQVLQGLKNLRTGTLDLDSVYIGAPRDAANPHLLEVGLVTRKSLRPLGKQDDNDVPREPMLPQPGRRPGQARIGDERNDENVIVSQLNVAFLKFHNALIRNHGMTFDEAQRAVRQHYQWLVLNDFLPRVCDVATVRSVTRGGPTLLPRDRLFMPLEFSVCAYRFGHSMVRSTHDVNSIFGKASLAQLFQFVESPNGVGKETPTLGSDWIVDWDRLIDRVRRGQRAMTIDTTMASKLLSLPIPHVEPPLNNLAVRNLLRGFLLGMPTGQAVARALGVAEIAPVDLLDNAATSLERSALADAGFDEATPLWYYILAEASIQCGGNSLGQVGSRIVVETFVRFVRESADSILRTPDWRPTLPSTTPGTFTLSDLLAMGGA